MAKTKFSKVHFKKPNSSMEFTTEEYLLDTLELITSKSRLPIKQLLSLVSDNKVDSISCSRDDTNYYFYARARRDNISIIVKQLGEQTMEFEVSRNQIKKFSHLPSFL